MKAFTDIPWTAYFWNMLRSIVTGIGAAGSAWVGTTVGNKVTEQIHTLGFYDLLSVLAGSVLVSFFAYLQINGLPAMKEKADNAAK